MATTHDHTHDPAPSDPNAPEEKGLGRTLLIQGAILGGILVLLLLATLFDLI